MRVHLRCNIDKIQPLFRQHRRSILTAPRYAEVLCSRVGVSCIVVANGYQFDADAPHLMPGMQMVLSKETASDQSTTHHQFHHNGCAKCL